jgi:hypothetical protein
MTTQKIYVGIDNDKIELTGKAKEDYLAQLESDKQARLLLEAEYKAKRDARESAITKLGEIAGLTKEELDAIL